MTIQQADPSGALELVVKGVLSETPKTFFEILALVDDGITAAKLGRFTESQRIRASSYYLARHSERHYNAVKHDTYYTKR